MRARKNAAGEALAFPNQPKKQMLGLNGNAAELAGLVTCEEEHSSGAFGVPFEHPGYLSESGQCCGHKKTNHIIRHLVTAPTRVSGRDRTLQPAVDYASR